MSPNSSLGQYLQPKTLDQRPFENQESDGPFSLSVPLPVTLDVCCQGFLAPSSSSIDVSLRWETEAQRKRLVQQEQYISFGKTLAHYMEVPALVLAAGP